MIRNLRRTGVAAALGAVLLLGPGGVPAVADSGVTLPIESYADIAVDGAHHQVFVSDPSGSSIMVTDYDGAPVKRITSEPGADGLVLSDDSETLYVALHADHSIAAIDTATLQETRRYALGEGIMPSKIAPAGGRLWFSYYDEVASGSDIGSLDLSDQAPEVELAQRGSYFWYYPPLLASSPGDPAVLVAGAPAQSPAQVGVYDVSSGTAQERAYRSNPGSNGSDNLQDMAVTPDGQEVILASGYPYHHAAYRTSDLGDSVIYETYHYPTAVAVTADGRIAAGVSGSDRPTVYLFNPGEPTAYRTLAAGTNALTTLAPAGLAWAPDGSRLFAVTDDYGTSYVSLSVLLP
jgi:hypothetical protein